MHRHVLAKVFLLSLIVLMAVPAAAQDIDAIKSKVTSFTLDNGLQFIVYENHDAPVFTYFSQVKVGAVNEVPGITGLAHMFEHMAFKGTPDIGTSDYKKEMKLIAKVDETYDAWAAARIAGASEGELETLWEKVAEAQEAAGEPIVTNEFGSIVEKNGGTGLNAYTTPDITGYFYSMPSNKLELWAYLESERFERPVMREFYKERDVVMEERRMRTESSPIGRLIEEFLAASYLGHPYGQPTVGHMSDLQSFTRQDAVDFYEKYYPPSNIVVCLAGDVDPDEVKKLAEKYFGDWKTAPVPEPVRTVEPEQRGERRVTMEDPGQPFYLVAYHKPNSTHPDSPVFDVITELVANGRSSRLHGRLVKEEKKAIQVGAITGIPGEIYPGLLISYAVPSKGVSALECEAAVLEEFERLKTEMVGEAELEGVKTRMKTNWVRGIRSNQGMAGTLLQGALIHGDWEAALNYGVEIDAVSAADIQRIANEYFNTNNRTVGLIVTEEGADDAS
ncbi:MAG: insulinase family protein [Gemmatimonadetes bacterium]|nr:insulinase family protein [Gemmatimonadota bacterium]